MDLRSATFYVCTDRKEVFFLKEPSVISTQEELDNFFARAECLPHGYRIFLARRQPQRIIPAEILHHRVFLQAVLTRYEDARRGAITYIANQHARSSHVISLALQEHFKDSKDPVVQEAIQRPSLDRTRNLMSQLKNNKLAEILTWAPNKKERIGITVRSLSGMLERIPEIRTHYQAIKFVNEAEQPTYYHWDYLQKQDGRIVRTPNEARLYLKLSDNLAAVRQALERRQPKPL